MEKINIKFELAFFGCVVAAAAVVYGIIELVNFIYYAAAVAMLN